MNCFNVDNILNYWRKTSFTDQRNKVIRYTFQHNKLGYTILLIFYLNVLNIHALEHSNISYVDECRADCARRKDPFTCGKFRAVQWLHNFTSDKDIYYGRIRFIRIASPVEEVILPELPRTRGFGKYSKFLNFIRSSFEDMLTHRALVYTVEQSVNPRSLSFGPSIMDADELDEYVQSGRSVAEERISKKKKKTLSLVLPVLILLKVFKLKLLLIPILIAVHFIKKIILIGALAIPSILSNLKYCKIQPPMPHHPTAYSSWATAAEAPIDFSSVAAHEDDGWNQKIDTTSYGGIGTHDSLLASVQRNPYRRYYQALRQQQLQNLV